MRPLHASLLWYPETLGDAAIYSLSLGLGSVCLMNKLDNFNGTAKNGL